jgi:hypothetical protein
MAAESYEPIRTYAGLSASHVPQLRLTPWLRATHSNCLPVLVDRVWKLFTAPYG